MAVFVFGSPSAVTPSYSPTFADNSWQKIAQACQENNVPATWAVGDSKIMQINNVDYQVDIIGKNHDVYADGTGKAPLTFQLHNLYGTHYAMHTAADNSAGWAGCAMRLTHLPSVLNLMPGDVQPAIREVNKLTYNKAAALETTKDKLFMLSEMEIFGVVTYATGEEGMQYEYYIPEGRTIKHRGVTQDAWWQRSLRKNLATFCRVSAAGNAGSSPATTVSPIAFAFCF